jgi:hypothetical protein
VQSWSDGNQETVSGAPNGIHNHVNTRAELEDCDPDLAAPIAGVFRDTPRLWRRPRGDKAAGRGRRPLPVGRGVRIR